MVRLPRRTLADWTPDAGDVDAWLARWAEAGWKPEHPWGGTDTVVNGIAGSAFPEADPDLVRTALGSTPSPSGCRLMGYDLECDGPRAPEHADLTGLPQMLSTRWT